MKVLIQIIELKFYLISVIAVPSRFLSKYLQLAIMFCFNLFKTILYVNLTFFYLKIYFKLKIILKIDGFFTFNLEDFLYLFLSYITINESFVLFYFYPRKSCFTIENR